MLWIKFTGQRQPVINQIIGRRDKYVESMEALIESQVMIAKGVGRNGIKMA